jgi:hypothetical protein
MGATGTVDPSLAGAVMTTQPRWEDSGQSDLLELVAMGSSTGTADHEWDLFESQLRWVAARESGSIRPNRLRPYLRDMVAPKRIGAFTSRAVARGLIEATGEWEVSDDTRGRNAGRPCRVYRWIGGAL